MEEKRSFGGFSGDRNPNWKGGPIDKVCEICGKEYLVKRPQYKSKYCSMQCVGKSQKGVKMQVRAIGKDYTSTHKQKECFTCGQINDAYSCMV